MVPYNICCYLIAILRKFSNDGIIKAISIKSSTLAMESCLVWTSKKKWTTILIWWWKTRCFNVKTLAAVEKWLVKWAVARSARSIGANVYASGLECGKSALWVMNLSDLSTAVLLPCVWGVGGGHSSLSRTTVRTRFLATAIRFCYCSNETDFFNCDGSDSTSSSRKW